LRSFCFCLRSGGGLLLSRVVGRDGLGEGVWGEQVWGVTTMYCTNISFCCCERRADPRVSVVQAKAGGGALTVETTSNQDTPAMEEGKVPLLGVDVWEHAYYLKYQNKRPAYIEAFWQIVNWAAVESRFLEARDGPGGTKPEL
jgi:hypothetical protein